jgi:hypothetical protein
MTFNDEDNKPINPSEGAILEISTRLDPHKDNSYITQKFDIVKVSTDYDLAMFICNLAPHRKHLNPINPVATSNDINNENRFFNRKLLSVEDINHDFDEL